MANITIKKSIWTELDEMRSQYAMNAALQAQAQDAAMQKLEIEMGFSAAQKELDRLHQKELKDFEVNMRIWDKKEADLSNARSDLKAVANADAESKYAFSTLDPIKVSSENAEDAIKLAEGFHNKDANAIRTQIKNLNEEIGSTEHKLTELNNRMQFISEADDFVNELALIAGPLEESFTPSDINRLTLDIPYVEETMTEEGMLKDYLDPDELRNAINAKSLNTKQLQYFDLTKDSKVDRDDLLYLNALISEQEKFADIDGPVTGRDIYDKVLGDLKSMDNLEELNKALFYEQKLGKSTGAAEAKNQYLLSDTDLTAVFKGIKNNVSVVTEDADGNQSIILNPQFAEKFRSLMSDSNSNIYTADVEKQEANIYAMEEMIKYIVGAETPTLMIERVKEYEKRNPQLVSLLNSVYPTLFSRSYHELQQLNEDRDYWLQLWKQKAGLVPESKKTIREDSGGEDDEDWELEIDGILGGGRTE